LSNELHIQTPKSERPPEPQRRRRVETLFERYVQLLMLVHGLTYPEATAQAQLEFPHLASGKGGTIMPNYVVTEDGTMIEEPLTRESAGDLLGRRQEYFVTTGQAKNPHEGLKLAREENPEAARVYDIEGPRNVYEPPEGEQLLRDLKTRYSKGAGDRSGIVSASTLFEFQNELFNVIESEAERTGRNARADWEQLLKNDAELRRAVGLSRS